MVDRLSRSMGEGSWPVVDCVRWMMGAGYGGTGTGEATGGGLGYDPLGEEE